MSALLLGLLRKYWLQASTLLAAAVVGAYLAWWIQDLRLTSLRNDFEGYKTEVREAAIQAERAASRQRDDAAREYAHLERKLQDEIKSGEVWQRCLAVGKCGYFGGVSKPAPGGAATTPAGSLDGAGADAIPAFRGSATQIPSVIGDCAETTLMLNRLQTYIESQPGYNEF